MVDLFATDRSVRPFVPPAHDGYAAAWDGARGGYAVTVPGGAFFYAEHFLDLACSDRAVAWLQESDAVDWRQADWRGLAPADAAFRNICWQQDRLTLYGRSIPLPRLTAWYGDEGKAYTYSGITSLPNRWNDGLLRLKARVEKGAGVAFNSVLLNWYRDGGDRMGWHADDEKELGADPVIASLSLGATRDFRLRRNTHHDQKITLPLGHGTLLVMRGALQHHWQHEVPARKAVTHSRFNLTFRTIHG